MEREASPQSEAAMKPLRRKLSRSWSPHQAAWHLVHTQGKEATSSHGDLFLHPNCWRFPCTTCLTHRKGKGTNIYQVPAACSVLLHIHSSREHTSPMFWICKELSASTSLRSTWRRTLLPPRLTAKCRAAAQHIHTAMHASVCGFLRAAEAGDLCMEDWDSPDWWVSLLYQGRSAKNGHQEDDSCSLPHVDCAVGLAPRHDMFPVPL